MSNYRKHSELSIELWLNRLNYPVYIIDENLKIQFQSKPEQKFIQPNPNIEHQLCYETIMHRKSPCNFCKIFSDNINKKEKFSQRYERNFNFHHLTESEHPPGSRSQFSLFQNMLKTESGKFYLVESTIPTRPKDNAEDQLITLGAMVQTMAHELSNPLTGINLTLQAIHNLIEKEASNIKPKLQKIINLLEKDARRASGILSAIQNYTKPIKQHARLCKIKLVIQEALGISLRTQPYISPNIIWNWELPEDIYVSGSRQKLEQCFINLFVNAFEAFRESNLLQKAMIEIHAGYPNRINQSKKLIYIQIIDNAGGLLFEDMDSIFSPFKSTKKDHPGLGLFIVRKILSEHKAEINLNRENDKTYFTITIESNV